MYVTMPLSCRKETVEIQFQTLLCGPARLKGKAPLQRRRKGIITVEEILIISKKMWGLHSWIYQAVNLLKRNEALPTSFKNADNCSNPSYLTAQSVLDCFVPVPGSMAGIQHKAQGKGVSSLHYTLP